MVMMVVWWLLGSHMLHSYFEVYRYIYNVHLRTQYTVYNLSMWIPITNDVREDIFHRVNVCFGDFVRGDASMTKSFPMMAQRKGHIWHYSLLSLSSVVVWQKGLAPRNGICGTDSGTYPRKKYGFFCFVCMHKQNTHTETLTAASLIRHLWLQQPRYNNNDTPRW